VPENIKAVAVSILLLNTAVNKLFVLRSNGNANLINVARLNTQTALVATTGDLIVAPDSEGKIEYSISAAGWLLINLTVKGWWF